MSVPGESPQVEGLFQMDSLTALSFMITMKFDEDTEQVRTGLDQQGNQNGKVDDSEAKKFEDLMQDNIAAGREGSGEASTGGMMLDGKKYKDVDEDPAVESSGLRGSKTSSKDAVLVRVTYLLTLDGAPASGSRHELTAEKDEGEGSGDENGTSGKVTIRVPANFKITSVSGDLRKNSDCEAGASDMNDVEEFVIAFAASDGSCDGEEDEDGGFLPAAPWAGLVALAGGIAVVGRRRNAAAK